MEVIIFLYSQTKDIQDRKNNHATFFFILELWQFWFYYYVSVSYSSLSLFCYGMVLDTLKTISREKCFNKNNGAVKYIYISLTFDYLHMTYISSLPKNYLLFTQQIKLNWE